MHVTEKSITITIVDMSHMLIRIIMCINGGWYLKTPASVNVLTEAGKAWRSYVCINRDLSTEVDVLPTSVKHFCPPPIRLL